MTGYYQNRLYWKISNQINYIGRRKQNQLYLNFLTLAPPCCTINPRCSGSITSARYTLKPATWNCYKYCKGMILYSTVSSPLDRSKRLTLHSLADLFIPTPTRLPWKHSSHATIVREDYSLPFPPPPIARYSWFIQLSELVRCGEN